MKHFHYAFFSGAFASFGSFFGKLTDLNTFAFEYFLFIKVAFFLLMLLCNTFGCTFFIKGLHQSDSSLPVTVITAATNYFLSALIGYMVFGEFISILSWCGMTFILIGLMLITDGDSVEDKKEK